MHDIQSAKKRISASLGEALQKLDGEISLLMASSEQGAAGGAPNTIRQQVKFAIDLATLRERLNQLRDELRIEDKEATPAETKAASLPHPAARASAHTQGLPKLAYSRSEAGMILGVSPITIDRLVSRGLLRPSLATRRPLFSPDELNRFMRETSKSVFP